MHQGLSDLTSVGRCGRYHDHAGNGVMALNTCAAYGLNLFTFGAEAKLIGAPAMGPEVTTRVVQSSWTGRTIELQTANSTQRIDLRHSLPGPMFTPADTRWGFDWQVKESPQKLILLPDGKSVPAWKTIDRPGQIFLALGGHTPVLVVTSEPAVSLEIVTHEHWWFEFAGPGARIMLVPLLDEADAPRSEAQAKLWLDLIASPPVACSEQFELADDVLTIRSDFTAPDGVPALVAPLGNLSALWGTKGGLQSLDDHTRMLTTVLGPYAVCAGSSHVRTIRMDWTAARIEPTREVKGELAEVPMELAYPGDSSWDEATPMDALLSTRQWALLEPMTPPDIWRRIAERITIPTPEAFRLSLVARTEPANGRTYMKEANLFDYCGDVSYDTDWYNGLTLSGLQRACDCGDEGLSAPARLLAGEVAHERAQMLAYYEIYNDWSLDTAWTDPRGEVLDVDCSHNGMEGILAEARLRQAEGNREGRDFCLYLAGRMAVSFLSMFDLATLSRDLGFVMNPPDKMDVTEELFGVRGYREIRGAGVVTAGSRSPVLPAPMFPEYCMLLRKYGPMDRFRLLADLYVKEHPERYEDWLVFYVGEKAKAIRSGTNEVGSRQEARSQAAVFYHVEHDTALRLWVLQQEGDEVEALYDIEMPLAPQLCCRAGVKLVEGR